MPTDQKSRWFAVATASSPETVERYLYSHTTIALSETVEHLGRTYFVALFETVADTEDRAQYLAQYQADRLASGLITTTQPRPTHDEALADLKERVGVTL